MRRSGMVSAVLVAAVVLMSMGSARASGNEGRPKWAEGQQQKEEQQKAGQQKFEEQKLLIEYAIAGMWCIAHFTHDPAWASLAQVVQQDVFPDESACSLLNEKLQEVTLVMFSAGKNTYERACGVEASTVVALYLDKVCEGMRGCCGHFMEDEENQGIQSEGQRPLPPSVHASGDRAGAELEKQKIRKSEGKPRWAEAPADTGSARAYAQGMKLPPEPEKSKGEIRSSVGIPNDHEKREFMSVESEEQEMQTEGQHRIAEASAESPQATLGNLAISKIQCIADYLHEPTWASLAQLLQQDVFSDESCSLLNGKLQSMWSIGYRVDKGCGENASAVVAYYLDAMCVNNCECCDMFICDDKPLGGVRGRNRSVSSEDPLKTGSGIPNRAPLTSQPELN